MARPLFVRADARPAFVASYADLVRSARRYPGCVDLFIAADPSRLDVALDDACVREQDVARTTAPLDN